MNIEQSVAIVTGASSGLGAATARALGIQGAHVVVLDRDAGQGSVVAKEIGGSFVAADVADEGEVADAIDQASEIGPLRILVNCAGIGRAAPTVSRDGVPYDLKRFELVLRVNLVDSFNCLRLAAAAMSRLEPLEDGERGVIVNAASVAAFDGQIGQAAYSASKGGLVGMTLPIARDLASFGI